MELTGSRAAHKGRSRGRRWCWVGSWASAWARLDKVCSWAPKRRQVSAGRRTPSRGPSACSSRRPRSGLPCARTSRHRTHLEGGSKGLKNISRQCDCKYVQKAALYWFSNISNHSSGDSEALQGLTHSQEGITPQAANQFN